MIVGKPNETMPQLKQLVAQSRPTRIVTVGDVVTNEARAAGIKVDLGIIDGKTMRHESVQNVHAKQSILHTRNPAGTITEEAWKAVKNAMKKKGATIFVEGEEDLLTIPAVMEAPEGAIVVYGQPSEGIVIVTVTGQKKAELTKILETWASLES